MGLMGLSGCAAMDMQGHNPQEYYKKNPIQNKVEMRDATYQTQFERGENRLSPSAVAGLRGEMNGVSPLAVETASVALHPSQMRNPARKSHLKRLLRSMGYSPEVIMFEPSDALGRDEVEFNFDYASVVSPRCPDWRTSGVTTYSNTSQAGFGCAYTNNLGLMVADPRDLEQGRGRVSADPTRAAKAIQDYRSGGKSGGSDSASGSSGSQDAGSSISTTP